MDEGANMEVTRRGGAGECSARGGGRGQWNGGDGGGREGATEGPALGEKGETGWPGGPGWGEGGTGWCSSPRGAHTLGGTTAGGGGKG